MKIQFDTSFALTDTVRRARHGRPWTDEEYGLLRKSFMQGHSLQQMCELLQRPAEGTLNKLRSEKLICFDSLLCCDYYVALPINHPTRLTHSTTELKKEEPTMNKNLIETKTFVNGVDATGMSDTEIFSLIAKTEAEIAKLEAIKTPSKKLAEAIGKLKTGVAELAEYVDNRE